MNTFYAKGALFENLIINEFIKNRFHQGLDPRLFFWRNKTKQEVDLIIDHPDQPVAIEIKSGKTLQESYFQNLNYWQKISGEEANNLKVIYGGDSNISISTGIYVSWRNIQTEF